MLRKRLLKGLDGVSIDEQKGKIIQTYDSLLLKTIKRAENYFRRRERYISSRIINEVLREDLVDDFDTEIEVMWKRLKSDEELIKEYQRTESYSKTEELRIWLENHEEIEHV